jgi:hypothetical protein
VRGNGSERRGELRLVEGVHVRQISHPCGTSSRRPDVRRDRAA